MASYKEDMASYKVDLKNNLLKAAEDHQTVLVGGWMKTSEDNQELLLATLKEELQNELSAALLIFKNDQEQLAAKVEAHQV